MASAIFDTHGFMKRLTAAGMPEPQAEILADEQFRLLHEQVATKGDIMTLRSEAARDIGALRSERAAMERRIKDQLTIRLGPMLASAIAIVAALVRLL